MTLIYSPAFEGMELKARMKHTAECLHHFMPSAYTDSIRLLGHLVESLKAHGFWQERLEMMFLPNYIELYGLDDLETSMDAMEVVTQYVSCEFAIRPFLNRYPEQILARMMQWTQHPHHGVRRLASEGCRPRLPWGLSVPRLKENPAAILPILTALKDDPSDVVRRSVANNLNDISKDHPELLLETATNWKGHSKETDTLIKHACRTLLKAGHERILSHFGLRSEGISIEDFDVLTSEVKIGGALQFSFRVTNTTNTPTVIRLEYAVYYRRSNGQLSRKVFKISERVYQPAQSELITRNQSFKLITTRKFYDGEHELEMIINGSPMVRGVFVVSH